MTMPGCKLLFMKLLYAGHHTKMFGIGQQVFVRNFPSTVNCQLSPHVRVNHHTLTVFEVDSDITGRSALTFRSLRLRYLV